MLNNKNDGSWLGGWQSAVWGQAGHHSAGGVQLHWALLDLYASASDHHNYYFLFPFLSFQTEFISNNRFYLFFSDPLPHPTVGGVRKKLGGVLLLTRLSHDILFPYNFS